MASKLLLFHVVKTTSIQCNDADAQFTRAYVVCKVGGSSFRTKPQPLPNPVFEERCSVRVHPAPGCGVEMSLHFCTEDGKRSQRVAESFLNYAEAVNSATPVEGDAWVRFSPSSSVSRFFNAGEVYVTYATINSPAVSEPDRRAEKLIRFNKLKMTLVQVRQVVVAEDGPSASKPKANLTAIVRFGAHSNASTPFASESAINQDWTFELPKTALASRQMLIVTVWDQAANPGSTQTFAGEISMDLFTEEPSGSRWVALQCRAGVHEDEILQNKRGGFGELQLRWDFVYDGLVMAPEGKLTFDTMILTLAKVKDSGLLARKYSRNASFTIELKHSAKWAQKWAYKWTQTSSPAILGEALEVSGTSFEVMLSDISPQAIPLALYINNAKSPAAVGTASVSNLDGITGTRPVTLYSTAIGEEGQAVADLDLSWAFVQHNCRPAITPPRGARAKHIGLTLCGVFPGSSAASECEEWQMRITSGSFMVVSNGYDGVGPNNEWNEFFDIPVSANDGCIVFQLLGVDGEGKVREFGQAVLSCNEALSFGHRWLVLRPAGCKCAENVEPGISAGEISLSVLYVSDEQSELIPAMGSEINADLRSQKLQQYTDVKLKIVAGRGLYSKTGSADFSVVAKFGKHDVLETKIITHEPNPKWNEQVTLSLSDPTATLALTVVNNPLSALSDGRQRLRSRMSIVEKELELKHLYLGEAAIDLLAQDGAVGEKWLPLTPVAALNGDSSAEMPKEGELGELLVAWQFVTPAEKAVWRKQKRSDYTMVRVEILEGRGLIIDGRCPSVNVSFGEGEKFCTKGSKRAQKTIWNESFMFDIISDNQILALDVVDDDSLATGEPLGAATLDIAGEEGENGQRWVRLTSNDPRLDGYDSLGEVFVRWQFSNDAEKREFRKAKMRSFTHLQVEVMRGRSLLPRVDESNGSAPPSSFVQLDFGPASTRTRVVRASSAPLFNQSFLLPLDKASDRLVLTCFDYNKLKGIQFLGTATVDLNGFKADEGEQWILLLPRRYHTADQAALQKAVADSFGNLLIRWKYTSTVVLDQNRRKIVDEGFDTIIVNPIEAVDLFAGDAYGRYRPSVRCSLGSVTQNVPSAKSRKNCVWDHPVRLPVTQAEHKLSLFIVDQSKPGEEQIAGTTEIDVLAEGQTAFSGWFTLNCPPGSATSTSSAMPLPPPSIYLQWQFVKDASNAKLRANKLKNYSLLVVDVVKAMGLPSYLTTEIRVVRPSCMLYTAAGRAVQSRSGAPPDPFWNESFAFEVEDFAKNPLLFLDIVHETQLDDDAPLQHKIVGRVQFDACAEVALQGERWFPVSPVSRAPNEESITIPDAECGQVLLAWQFVNDREKRVIRAKKAADFQFMEVGVVKAEGVMGPCSGPFARIAFNGVEFASRVVVAAQDPWWQQPFEFSIAETSSNLLAPKVNVQLWDQQEGAGKFLGECIFDVLAEKASDGSAWFPLKPRRYNEQDAKSLVSSLGRVFLQWRFYDSKQKVVLSKTQQKLQAFDGLRVWVDDAHGLRDRSQQPPFRTRIVAFFAGKEVPAVCEQMNAKDPFRMGWSFQLSKVISNPTLSFAVYNGDEDAAEGGTLLGKAEINIGGEEKASGITWIPIITGAAHKAEDAGELHVRWKFTVFSPVLETNMRKKFLHELLADCPAAK